MNPPPAGPFTRRALLIDLIRRIVPCAALLALAACADLFLEAERVPTSLALADSVLVAAEGQRVHFRLVVLDQHGRAFDRRPRWAVPAWGTSDPAVVGVEGGELVAVAPGEARATVTLAGLSAAGRVRVNPPRLRLTVPRLQLTQSAQPEGGTAVLVIGDVGLRIRM